MRIEICEEDIAPPPLAPDLFLADARRRITIGAVLIVGSGAVLTAMALISAVG